MSNNQETGLAHLKAEGAPMHPSDFTVGDRDWGPGDKMWEKQLKAYNDYFEIDDLPEDITEEQWKKFSEIQYATYLHVDRESVERCRGWLKSGNDEDAWG